MGRCWNSGYATWWKTPLTYACCPVSCRCTDACTSHASPSRRFATPDPAAGWPAPFPRLTRMLHAPGRLIRPVRRAAGQIQQSLPGQLRDAWIGVPEQQDQRTDPTQLLVFDPDYGNGFRHGSLAFLFVQGGEGPKWDGTPQYSCVRRGQTCTSHFETGWRNPHGCR